MKANAIVWGQRQSCKYGMRLNFADIPADDTLVPLNGLRGMALIEHHDRKMQRAVKSWKSQRRTQWRHPEPSPKLVLDELLAITNAL